MIDRQLYDNFKEILRSELIPALGCTEPAVTLLSGCGSKSAETVRSDAGEMCSVLQRKYR
mgnify:CR=1 FL=1